MMLGDILRKFDDPAAAEAALLQLDDLALLAQVAKAAESFGESSGEYVAASVARFSGEAKDDDWAAVLSGMARTENPGLICLRKMIEWSIAQDVQHVSGCGCGHENSATPEADSGKDVE